jgi:hypothetical protein
MMGQDFTFHVRGIEDAIIAALQERVGGPTGYAKTIVPYAGELDAEELRKESRGALSKLVSRVPLFLVAYMDGRDEDMAGDPWMSDEPREVMHRCTFVVICCAPDARGARPGQTASAAGVGAYRMVADAQTALYGRQFVQKVDDEDVVLNSDRLIPARQPQNVVPLMRMNEVTAFAVYFDTSFVYTTLNRQPEATAIEEVVFSIDPLNPESGPGGLPGVHFEQ